MQGIGTALLGYARRFIGTFNGKIVLAEALLDQQHFWKKNGFDAVKQKDTTVTYSLALR